MPKVQLTDMREEFLETRKQATFSPSPGGRGNSQGADGEQTMLMLNRRGFSSFGRLPRMWESAWSAPIAPSR